MNKTSKRQKAAYLVRMVCNLYSINSLVLLFAIAMAFVPQRPTFFGVSDQLFLELAATETQRQQIGVLSADGSDLTQTTSDPFATFSVSGLSEIGGEILSGEAFGHSEIHGLTPAWFPYAERGLILASALLMMWGLKYLSASAAVLSVVGTLLVLMTTQFAALTTQNIWLPFGVLLQCIAISYGLLLLQLKYQRKNRRLRLNLHQVSFAHAQSLFDEGCLEEAFDTLRNCLPNAEVLALIFMLAQAAERKRDLKSAFAMYQFIQQKNKRYPGVKDKLADIEAALSRHSSISQGTTSLEATMVVEQNAPLPKLGRYKIQRELGRGAMGTVYLGEDPKIARELAIKTLSYRPYTGEQLEEVRDRFFREAKAAGRLSHPNIVTVYDVGEEADMAYIAMDYINGISLDAHCRKDMLLPVETVYQVILQVAEALAYAHKQKIIHRDIKPSNLIFSPRTEQVKVSDFGIARMTDESKTRTGQVMGSPLYMSPEQLKGRPVNGAADIFSLGVTMYQLLTGSTPFIAESLPELTIKIMSRKHKSVRELRDDLPASAVRITNKALHKEPAKRFQSAEEMAEQLRKALANDFKARVA